ncbi:hypothetical protein PPYR_11797 [Photinus pyralis]|uniref:Thioredoxin domain-containing protein 17 n=1 Tax=Photinus pyralis TaxID=7054 RepID=A0A5N4ACI0_PHOPY|nr:thioredoxin domain-containing protein 17-like isoform X2 [Photinus pyralis]KAB0794958.1 hypothetical protein PPYR_11797 [Photinus pyralis]
MIQKYHVEGYEQFCEFMKKFTSTDEDIHIYFTGSKLPSGISWCSDCVKAKPIVEEALKHANPNSHFIVVDVGSREIWKDRNCPFRTDPKTRLLVIPTLMRWGHPQKLEGEQCEKSELVEMLFTDED